MVDVIQKYGFLQTRINDEGKIILVSGASGSGKSIAIQNYVYQFKRHLKGKVIYVTEKHVSAMENAFCCIDKFTAEQKQAIKEAKIPEEEIYPEKVEIYHPFTFAFPKFYVPENLKLFSFSLKSIDTFSYAALLGRNLESPSTIICQKVAQELKKNDNVFTFLHRVYSLASKKENEEEFKIVKPDIERMGIPLESYGSKKDISQITMIFSKFKKHYFLHEENSPYNLDDKKWKEIIKSNDVITMFTLWKIDEERLRYFSYIEILQKLHENISKSKTKTPLLIVLEEIKILLPRNAPDGSIEQQLIEVLRKMLAGLRSSGVTIIATTQSYYETNSDFRSGVEGKNVLLMKMTFEDLRKFSRDYRITPENYDQLVKLGRGEFVFMDSICGTHDIAAKFRFFHVPFAHRENKYGDFINEFKKTYPDKLINYDDKIKEMETKFNDDFRIHSDKIVKEMKEDKPNKKTNKGEDKEVKEDKGDSFVFNLEHGRKGYELVLMTPLSNWTNREKLMDIKIDRIPFQKNIVKYALSINDFDFIEKHIHPKFMETHFKNEK